MNPREARQHRGLGQIVFLYFVQKKGWLGVVKGQGWGTGPHDFLRRLANQSALSALSRKSDTPQLLQRHSRATLLQHTGQAKIHTGYQTVAARVWRYICQTFDFSGACKS